MNYLDPVIINIFLSTVALLLSIINSFSIHKANKVQLKMKVSGYFKSQRGILFYCNLTNYSQLPIAITDIAIKGTSKNINCISVPKNVHLVETKKGDILINTERYYSMPTPICLESLSGSSGYIYFDYHQEPDSIPSTEVNFLICTNRKKTIEMKLSLDQIPTLR